MNIEIKSGSQVIVNVLGTFVFGMVVCFGWHFAEWILARLF